jgi:hypothetical protein
MFRNQVNIIQRFRCEGLDEKKRPLGVTGGEIEVTQWNKIDPNQRISHGFFNDMETAMAFARANFNFIG